MEESITYKHLVKAEGIDLGLANKDVTVYCENGGNF